MGNYQQMNAKQKARRNGLKISLRITEWHLAHALTIVKALDPTYKMESTGKLVKLLFEDWIGIHSERKNIEPTLEAREEVRRLLQTTKPGVKLLSRETKAQREEQLLELINQDVQRQQKKTIPAEKPVPNFMSETMAEVKARQDREQSGEQARIEVKNLETETESIKTVVTDFSPPSMDELMDLGEDDD